MVETKDAGNNIILVNDRHDGRKDEYTVCFNRRGEFLSSCRTDQYIFTTNEWAAPPHIVEAAQTEWHRSHRG